MDAVRWETVQETDPKVLKDSHVETTESGQVAEKRLALTMALTMTHPMKMVQRELNISPCGQKAVVS